MHQKPTKTCITSAEFGRLYSDYNPRFTEVAYRYVRDRGIAVSYTHLTLPTIYSV